MIRLTIRQMEYFEALAETRHFGRAAALAGITQPALSAQIAEMEDRLGRRLFERSRTGVWLTEDGHAVAPVIARVLKDMRELEGMARRGRRPMEGRIRLGIIPTVAPYLLPRILPELKRRYPLLVTELREAVTDTLVEETLGGRLDAFVAALPIEDDRLVAEPLFKDRFFLAVPADDPAFASPPVPPESPELGRLMLLEEGHCLREQALELCGSVKTAAMASYGATSLTTLIQMVSHGLGITLVPEIAVPTVSALSDISLIPFTEPAPARTLCLAWRRNSPRGEEWALLAAFLRELPASAPEANGASLS
jgi:LysR family hydrogen peroxide-inducible transcriptional activator